MKADAQSFLPAVDAYINRAAPFAQPILEHVRELMHKAIPGVEEAIKWSMPFFVYKGIIIGNMAAFKAHCAMGIWGQDLVAAMREAGAVEASHSAGAMGNFGRLTTVKDLPADKVLLGFLKLAAKQIDSGERTQSFSRPAKKAAKPAPEMPEDLAAALKKSKPALATFEAFPPSCRREYIDWITEAKRAETRASRLTQAIQMLAEGKRRNWKYENC